MAFSRLGSKGGSSAHGTGRRWGEGNSRPRTTPAGPTLSDARRGAPGRGRTSAAARRSGCPGGRAPRRSLRVLRCPPGGRHPGGAPRRLGAFLPAQRQEAPRGRRAGASSRQVGGRQWPGGRKPGGGRAGTQDAGPGDGREREEGWQRGATARAGAARPSAGERHRALRGARGRARGRGRGRGAAVSGRGRPERGAWPPQRLPPGLAQPQLRAPGSVARVSGGTGG